MRRALLLCLLALLALGASAVPALAGSLPTRGFLVFKDTLRGAAIVEFRDNATGRVVARLTHGRGGLRRTGACTDRHHRAFSRWKGIPTYRVNVASVPSYLNPALARSQLVGAQEAWEGRMRTDCTVTFRSGFDARDGGNTTLEPTTVTRLAIDRQNVVGWVSLEGTVCDGALACVVADFARGRIYEADLAFERDLARYGFQDFWTTDETTWTDAFGGRFAISDVGTHEFGHFAGLDHVEKSPELTMYPLIHDGDDTLGLGDMLGMHLLYR